MARDRSPDTSLIYRPVVPLAIAFLSGNAGAILTESSPWPWSLVAGLSLVVWFLIRRVTFWERYRDAVSVSCTLLAVTGVGGAIQSAERNQLPNDELVRWVAEDPRPISLRVQIERVDLIAESTFGSRFPTASHRSVSPAAPTSPPTTPTPETSTRFPNSSQPLNPRWRCWARVLQLKDQTGWSRASGKIELWVTSRVAPSVGDECEVQGRAKRPPRAGNPRQFCRRTWLARHGIQVTMTVETYQVRRSSSDLNLSGQLAAVRAAGRERLLRVIDGPTSGLAIALVLGLRDDLDLEVSESFQRTGIGHVLSISGLHVGLLLAAVMSLGRSLGVASRRVATAAALLVMVYAALAGAGPAVLRAVILAAVGGWGWIEGRRGAGVQSLACAAIALVAYDPAAICDLGAQLSFLGVGALMMASGKTSTPHWAPLMRRWHASRPLLIRWSLNIVGRLWDVTWTTTLVILVTLPLVAHYFHMVAWGAWLLNPWLGPAVALALLAALIVVCPICPEFVAVACGGLIRAALTPVVTAAQFVDRSVPPWQVPGPSQIELWGVYLGFALCLLLGKRRAVWWGAGWLSLWFVMSIVVPEFKVAAGYPAPARTDLECTFIDVGHGNATLIRWPNGTHWLCDAGSARGDRAAVDAISAVLWDRGVRRIDKLLLSHPDRDHFNGAIELAERFVIDELGVPEILLGANDLAWQQTLARYAAAGVRVVPLARGDELHAGETSSGEKVSVHVLHPERKRPPSHEGDNADSLVLAFEVGGVRGLLPGDLEGEATAEVIRLAGRVDLLVAPHHGSPGSEPERWIKQCEPRLVIVSGARRFAWMPVRHESSRSTESSESLDSPESSVRPLSETVSVASTLDGGCLTVRWPLDSVYGSGSPLDAAPSLEVRAWLDGNRPQFIRSLMRTAYGGE